MLRSILHCDMNNFYASVECMLDPALKKYPIAVCGSVEERHGIVLAKNYKAKAFDVKTGDAVWQAKQKCKDLVVVPPHYEEYIKYSKLARSVYERYTDQVEPYGMDECWLDISGTESLFGSPEKVANEIRETMKFELGLTISVGVSFNKIFAKLGSDMKKPDAVTVIPKDTFKEKIWGLPAADLLGVGRATQRVLDSYCIRTISDLITQQDDIKVIEIKDYIKNPKSNGYRSYHMIVEIPVFFAKGKTPMRVELQIRTNGMDFWATLEHQLRYKKGIEEMPGYDEISEELLHSARAIIEADNEMQRIKDKIGMFHEI